MDTQGKIELNQERVEVSLSHPLTVIILSLHQG